MSTKQLLCRHHSLGSCNFGVHCMFSHDAHRSVAIPDNACLFNIRSSCINGDACNNVHLSIADILNASGGTQGGVDSQMRPSTSRRNSEDIDARKKECFGYHRSQHLTCSVCLDVVLDKPTRKSRQFGLLSSCSHVFCLDCIRTWRTSNRSNKRTCPECRTESDFYIASEFFYDNKDAEKAQMIAKYRETRAGQHCRHFNRGRDRCPFGGACLYKHEYPCGRSITMPMPDGYRGPQNGVALQSIVQQWDDLVRQIGQEDVLFCDYLDIL